MKSWPYDDIVAYSIKSYKPMRLHPLLFGGNDTTKDHDISAAAGAAMSSSSEACTSSLSERQRQGWRQEWFDGSFFRMHRYIEDKNRRARSKKTPAVAGPGTGPVTVQDLLDQGFIVKEEENIYSFPFLSPEFCKMMIEEQENYSLSGLPVFRPNSMNNYGLVLNQVGMADMMNELQEQYLQPLSRVLFPFMQHVTFDSQHSFLVSYEPHRDMGLDMHTDDSEVTFNCCLGKEGFMASGLTFCGVKGADTHRQFSLKYVHRLGRAVVHLGNRRHGADDIVSGQRVNLIVWCKCHVWRQTEEYAELVYRYVAEAGPPDERCLSVTHDRDFAFFKKYPKGRNPYHAEDGSVAATSSSAQQDSMPWCPPEQFCYDVMKPTQELLVISHANADI